MLGPCPVSILWLGAALLGTACASEERHIAVLIRVADGAAVDATAVRAAVAHDGPGALGSAEAELPRGGGSDPIDFPADLVVLIGDASGIFTTSVDALGRDDAVVASGRGEVAIDRGGDGLVGSIDVVLAPVGTCPARAPEGPATCGDGRLDGDETDLDCGGGCPPCAPERRCLGDDDCQSGSCLEGACARASGPPFWLPVPRMVSARTELAAALGGDGLLYAIGGREDGVLTSVERFDPERSTWSAAPPLPRGRFGLAGVTDGDGRIWAIGGDDGDGARTDVAILDTRAGSWAAGDPLHTARYGLAATASPEGVVWALAGRDGDQLSPTVEEHGPDGWTAVADLLHTHSMFAAVRAPDGSTYVLDSSSLEIYRPGGGAEPLPGLTPARDQLGAALGPDGRVYAIGGWADDAVSVVEALAPGLRRWEPVSPLQPRAGLAVAVAPDGRIFAFGGAGPTGTLDVVEAYGPVARLLRGEDPLLSSDAVRPAELLFVGGENFSADARVSVAIGMGGCDLASGLTDEEGRIAEPIALRVPAGLERLELVVQDDRSRYPVTLRAMIEP